MADIFHQIPIAALPKRVLVAITTEGALRKWWTADCEAKPEVGALDVFRFDGGNVEFRFHVDEQTPSHVAWTCVEGPKVPAEWVGTRVVFDLSPDGRGTMLRFGHLGWRSVEGGYAQCNTVWGELMQRLRAQAEGRPTEPYFAARPEAL
jgi:uncharacterized protein YndB with AHSA1/START domain